MPQNTPASQNGSAVTRREFVKTSAALAAATGIPGAALGSNWFHARGSDTIRIGLIGCGGRGTGAAANALEANPGVQIVAQADVFADRLTSSKAELAKFGDRAKVADSRCFSGFDAYKQLLATETDSVILATPPGFRPTHFAAAIAAGRHVFMEKPVAVDGPGIRTVIAAGEAADKKKLCVVAGTQRRHETCYLEMMKRIKDGAIGKIVSARCSWNQNSLWMNARKAEWSDMEWQLRNWLYFTWLSGDHIVEQHVHNLDVCNWAIGSHPVRAYGMGGRQVRTGPEFGHIFDHFAIEYEYPGGVFMHSMSRQIDGCDNRVEESIHGSDGSTSSSSGRAAIAGKNPWKFEDGKNNAPYVQEHTDLYAAIQGGKQINEARTVAESTLTAIMGRMSCYTGKAVTWDQALNSKQALVPAELKMGPLPVPPVAVPGRTRLE